MKSVIELDDEIFLNDAYLMADWLENEEITRYISEGSEISNEIRSSLRYTTCPIVTHMFCSGGNFYMVKHNGRSIGYLKLVNKGSGTAEIVVVIGDEDMWNKGYGTEAVRLALEECFFRLRYERLTAVIRNGNEGSHHVFRKAGFVRERNLTASVRYLLELDQYLKLVA